MKKSIRLREAMRLASEKVRDPNTPADVFVKLILFLERHSNWKQRERKPRQESDIHELVRKIEMGRKTPKGGLQ